MTTNHHTAIVNNDARNNDAAIWNDPMAQLDSAISQISTSFGGALTTRSSGGAAGATTVTPASTTGFVAGATVAYLTAAGVEYNTIASIDSGVFTFDNAIQSSISTVISQVGPSESYVRLGTIGWRDVTAYGARADAVGLTDGAITATATTFTSAAASFGSGDVGKSIQVVGAGAAGAVLETTIASINGLTSVELTDAAGTTVSGAVALYGTNSTTGFQAADDAAAANGGTVLIPPGAYMLAQSSTNGYAVLKSVYTNWEGQQSRSGSNLGARLLCEANIEAVRIYNDSGATVYARWASMRNITLVKTYASTHTLSMGLRIFGSSGSLKQIVLDNLAFVGFEYGLHVTSGGELILSVLRSAGCKYSIYGVGVADSYFNHCVVGAGTAFAGTGGYPLYLQQSGNITAVQSRFQVQQSTTGTGGTGILAQSCRNLKFIGCINDQNDVFGTYLENCQDVDIQGCDIYDNGLTTANKAGVRIQAVGEAVTFTNATELLTISGSYIPYAGQRVRLSTTDTLPAELAASTDYYVIRVSATTLKLAATFADAQAGTAVAFTDDGTGTHTLIGVCDDIRIIGGQIHDRNKGAADEVQDIGVQIAESGSGEVDRVTVDHVRIDCTTAISGAELAAKLQVNLAGRSPITTITDSTPRAITAADGDSIVCSTALGAALALRMEAPTNRTHDRVRVTRTSASTGNYQINVQTSAATTLYQLYTNAWCDVAYDEATGNYVLVGAGSLLQTGQSVDELTIASGVIAVTGSYHTVDTEADGATDNLATINGGTKGQIVVLSAANDARTVVVKDGTGNLQLAGDFSLDNTQDTIMLIYNGTAWLELSRSDSGA